MASSYFAIAYGNDPYIKKAFPSSAAFSASSGFKYAFYSASFFNFSHLFLASTTLLT